MVSLITPHRDLCFLSLPSILSPFSQYNCDPAQPIIPYHSPRQSQITLTQSQIILVLQPVLQILIALPRPLKISNYNIDNTPLINPREALTCLFKTSYTYITQVIRSSLEYPKDLNMAGTFQHLSIYITFLTSIKNGL